MKKEPTRPTASWPIVLHHWEDPFTLGAFCSKAGLLRYAKSHILYLNSPSDYRTRLFRKGMSDASSFTWDDLAFEIQGIRRRDPRRFDAYFIRNHPHQTLEQIHRAIKDAHDWETQEMVRNGFAIASAKTH
jgi:hypothetical protein